MKSNNKICTKLLALGSTLAVLGATGQAGLAQSDEDAGQLPPVMIISEAPQTESRSVTLLSGDTITLGGIQEVRDIQTALPNFTVFDANNTRMPKFSVRGLRENSFGVGQSAVGIYVDGIPYTDMMSRGLSISRLSFATLTASSTVDLTKEMRTMALHTRLSVWLTHR